MAGRYYDEWTIGDRLEHQPHRTVTETDNLLISTLTHNPQPLHLDAEYAGATEFGRIVVNGTFTFSLMIGLSVGDTTLGTLVANLGYDKVRMPKPVFIGDTLRAETEVTGLKESRSRPDAGIVTFEHRMLNQRGELVCVCERTALDAAEARVRLRSLLFVPGDRPDRMEKALGLGADALILDLEDAVAPAAKPEARRAVAAFLAAHPEGPALGADQSDRRAGGGEGPCRRRACAA
jgi:acyl dehydratase